MQRSNENPVGKASDARMNTDELNTDESRSLAGPRRTGRSPWPLLVVAVGAVLATMAFTELRQALTSKTDAASDHPAAVTDVNAPTLDADGRLHFQPQSAQLRQLRIETVKEEPLPATGQLAGRLVFDENVTSRVFSPIAGRVIKVVVEAGTLVKAGDVLAIIDSPDLGSVESDYQKAVAAERQKRAALDRVRTLYKGEVAPRKDLEAAQADFDQARAETRRARQRMDNLQAQQGDTEGRFALRSRIAGVVADRSIGPGLEVRPDSTTALFTITDPSRVWLLLDVPERLLGNIRVGQPLKFEVDAYPGMTFTGKTAVIGAALDPATHRVQVRATAVDPDHRLRAEMFTRAAFLVDDAKRGVAVPNTALAIDGQRQFVFVESAPGVFERRYVEPGLSDERGTFVTSGIGSGDRVVFEGALLLSADAESLRSR